MGLRREPVTWAIVLWSGKSRERNIKADSPFESDPGAKFSGRVGHW